MKKLIAILLGAVLLFSFCACDELLSDTDSYGDPSGAVSRTAASFGDSYDSGDTWAVYWYLCGSDLESGGGAASADLRELLEVALPDNIVFVIETGGAKEWRTREISSKNLGRYVYDKGGLYQVDEQPQANMGDTDTLVDFLSFCATNYPADHQAFIFWDHGGGSSSGVIFDEIYNFDSLSLNDIRTAFGSVYNLSEENPPFELVGFDACLMATLDTAQALSGVSKYMAASEESEPGNGWLYSGWAQDLAANPAMGGDALGKSICDSYVAGCIKERSEDEITLSVIDVGKISKLVSACDIVGREILLNSNIDSGFFSNFGRRAKKAENYGGNNKDQGYSNMVDIGDLIKQSADLIENEDAVSSALADCVIYSVSGPRRSNASGLSCFYPYSVNRDVYNSFREISASKGLEYICEYKLDGKLSGEAIDFINSAAEPAREELTEDDIHEAETFENSDTGTKNFPVYIDGEGYATLKIGGETANMLSGLYFELAFVSEEDDMALYLGSDNDIDMDWENGVFKDNFRSVWGAIDGHIVYMEINYESEDYNLYNVPILLNGEEYNLSVCYDYNDEEYYILGARRGLDSEAGYSGKNLVMPKPGDLVTTMLYASTISGDDEPELYEFEEIEITEDTSFGETALGDGEYYMVFKLLDMQDNYMYSQGVYLTIDGEEVYINLA
ncbi:MAG: hypothetical protein LBC56_04145 [Oscillospiraceae bacterium]|jgi:hypothetical protein|nr:hypothetical protein [Oscillospiraceae bacterium]